MVLDGLHGENRSVTHLNSIHHNGRGAAAE